MQGLWVTHGRTGTPLRDCGCGQPMLGQGYPRGVVAMDDQCLSGGIPVKTKQHHQPPAYRLRWGWGKRRKGGLAEPWEMGGNLFP